MRTKSIAHTIRCLQEATEHVIPVYSQKNSAVLKRLYSHAQWNWQEIAHICSMYLNYQLFSYETKCRTFDIHTQGHKEPSATPIKRIISHPLLPLYSDDKHLPKIGPGTIHKLFSTGSSTSPSPGLLWHVSQFSVPRTSGHGFWPKYDLFVYICTLCIKYRHKH